MIRIGFIDYYLDEWHANNYPLWIKEQGQGRFAVTMAYGDTEPEGKLSTAAWCEKMGIRPAATMEELVKGCDAIAVLSPDNPEQHLRLCQSALASGKPVFVDKTFAPDFATAQQLFQLAQEHGTPIYSSSALRYAREFAPLNELLHAGISATAVRGPGKFCNYAIHQLEMLVKTMGGCPRSAVAMGSEEAPCVYYDYGDGRSALLHCIGDAFSLAMTLQSGEGRSFTVAEDFWPFFIRDLLDFFGSGRPPVPPAQTLAAIAMYEAGSRALRQPGSRVFVPR